MKSKLLFLPVILMVLIAFSVDAKSKVLLRLNLQKGSVYEMTMSSSSNIDQNMMGQNMKIIQKMDMVYNYRILDVLPNKNWTVDYTVRKIKMDVSMNGQKMVFDSENPDENNQMYEPLKSLKDLKLTFELSSSGKVENVKGLDEYAKKLSGNRMMSQAMEMFASSENFADFISQAFNYFPETEVKTGDKWTSVIKLPGLMNMETTMNYEVAAIEKNDVVLNVTSDVNVDSPVEQGGFKMNVKMTGTQTGTMNIDTEDGWFRSTDLVQKFDVKMKMKNPQSGEDMEIPMKIDAVTKYTVVKK